MATSSARVGSILVSSSRFDLAHLYSALAERHPVDVVANHTGKRLSEDELISIKPDHCVGVVAGLEPWTERVVNEFPELKVIARLGTGVDNVDSKVVARRGITVLTTPDATTDAVAELTIGLMLAALRQLPTVDQGLRQGGWSQIVGGLLKDRVVGIVGFGRIGRRVATLVEAFGARPGFFDPDFRGSDSRRRATLGELLTSSDIVTLHVPLTTQTRGILGAAELATLKDGCVVVNAARGGLVDEDALALEVRRGRLRAAIDCFMDEPYRGPLRELDGTVLTPHIGSLTVETRSLMERTASQLLVEELQKLGIL